MQTVFYFVFLTKTPHMKKSLIGAIIGGLLIFIWQTLSWTMLDLHRPAQDHTPKQDSIMNFLNVNLDKEGGYLMPSAPKGTSFEEMKKLGEKQQGKPWAIIQYHRALSSSMNEMYMNMLRGFVATAFMVWLLCWILGKWNKASFFNIFLACIFTGLIVFINETYNTFIWYKIFDVRAHLIDALASWGLCGVWLGWWMRK
jgi:hypothetical protein